MRENIFANTSLNAGQLTSAFFAGLYSYDGWDVLNFGIEDLSNPKVYVSSNYKRNFCGDLEFRIIKIGYAYTKAYARGFRIYGNI